MGLSVWTASDRNTTGPRHPNPETNGKSSRHAKLRSDTGSSRCPASDVNKNGPKWAKLLKDMKLAKSDASNADNVSSSQEMPEVKSAGPGLANCRSKTENPELAASNVNSGRPK